MQAKPFKRKYGTVRRSVSSVPFTPIMTTPDLINDPCLEIPMLKENIKNNLDKIVSPNQLTVEEELIDFSDQNCFHPGFGDISSLVVDVIGDNRPYVDINVLGYDFRGLLDTGASVSVLGKGCEELILKLNIKKFVINTSVKTADGSNHSVNFFVNLPINFKNTVRVLPFLLVPGLAKEIILGMNFFELFGLEITLKNEIFAIDMEPELPNIPNSLPPAYLERLELVKQKFPMYSGGPLSCTHLLKYNIDTGKEKPIKQKHHYMSPYMQLKINDELDRMIRLDVVEPSSSPWASPIVCVKKKNGNVRLCLDSRRLNEVTVKESYPLPYISRILGRLHGTKYLSSIDLTDAFWQIPLDEESKIKTAFVVPSRGLYHFKRMPFGLCNAAQNLSKLMDSVLGYDLEPKVFVYLDDIVIATNDFEEHMEMLELVARRLKEANLTINLTKSKFCVPRLAYLGYILDEHGINVDSDKIKSITDYPVPKNVKEVRRFLGMCGWYRRFIVDFANKSAHISNLLKKSPKFIWTTEADRAFIDLKSALVSAPILAHPDFSKEFYIQCDASAVAVGGLIYQLIDEQEVVIAYTSQKLTATQQKYMACERELLGILYCIKQFRPYVEGTSFTVITDNSALLWLKSLKDPTGRLARWALKLQHYTFEIKHRPGKLNVVADALSRINIDSIDIQSNWYENLISKIASDSTLNSKYRFHNGNYFIFVKGNQVGSVDDEWKLIVNPSKITEILYECHDHALSGHLGYKKTLDRIRSKYFWPGLAKTVKDYVKNCERCKCTKYPTQSSRPLMGKPKEADQPWELVSIDFIGPLPRSSKGNTMLCVVIDFASKYCVLKPMRTGKTIPMIKFLEEEVFLLYSVPRILISDNGPQFTSKEFDKFLKSYNVKHHLTSRYTPQYNNCERVNRTIMSCIRAYLDGKHNKWDSNIAQISCALRTAIHDTTKYSPFAINFGRNMITSGEQYEKFIQPDNPNDDLAERKEKNLEIIMKHVKENISKSSTEVAKRYNLRARNIQYNVGDFVHKKNFSLSNAAKGLAAKLNDPFIKCKIIKKTGVNTYLLEDLNGRELGIFHAKDIQP